MSYIGGVFVDHLGGGDNSLVKFLEISSVLDTQRLCVGVRGRIFNSTAERLAIYSDYRYISRIFPTLLSQLISIFIRLLAKTRARLTQERTVEFHVDLCYPSRP